MKYLFNIFPITYITKFLKFSVSYLQIQSDILHFIYYLSTIYPPFFLHLRFSCNYKSNVPGTLLGLLGDALQPLPVPLSGNFPGISSDIETPFRSTNNKQTYISHQCQN